jgi:type II secretory pathway component PulJ
VSESAGWFLLGMTFLEVMGAIALGSVLGGLYLAWLEATMAKQKAKGRKK